MSATDLAPIGRINVGSYSSLTATPSFINPDYYIDSCIFEWLNCLTSLPAILLGLWGCYASLRDGLPRRYAVGYLGLAFIHVGGTAPHTVIAKLSKTYFASYVVYLLIDTHPGFRIELSHTIVLAAWSIVLSTANLILPGLMSQNIALATIILFCVCRYLALVKQHDLATNTKDKTAKLGTVCWAASALVVGLVGWYGNDYCFAHLRGARQVTIPLDYMLEGRTYWHFLAAHGVYLGYTSCIYLALNIKTSLGEFDYDATAWFPTCYRGSRR